MADPRWLRTARSYLGLAEIPGRRHNKTILKFWRAIRAPFTDDETPWCAAFVGACLEENGIPSTHSAAARSYVNWGTRLRAPVLGCIVVLARGTGGHVGFYLGGTGSRVTLLGGNQGDRVSIAAFPRSRVLAYRWPRGEPLGQVGDIEHNGGSAPEAIPYEPTMASSKTGWTATAVGFVGAGEALREGNEVATQVIIARDNAHELGIFDIIAAHPYPVAMMFAGLVVVAACVFIWWDHRRYRKALAEAQNGTPKVPG